MLREVKKVKQHENEGFRRWFVDDYFDLIIWYRDAEIIGFQLCYDKNNFERSLTWKRTEGFSHNKIDDGEVAGETKMTPILVPDGIFDNRSVAARFKEQRGELEPALFQFIYEKVRAARLT